MKKLFTGFFLLLFITSLFSQNANVSYRLTQAIQESPDATHHIGILLEDRVDIYAMAKEFDRNKTSIRERSEKVIAALKAKAAATQEKLIKQLKNHPDVEPQSVRGYWINNMVFAKVQANVVKELEEYAEVQKIDLNGNLMMVEYTKESCETLPPLQPGQAEPGLLAINADEMWKMGYTGRGRVALGADTGIDPSHPAIRNQYRGLYFDEDYTWFDSPTANNNGSNSPNDCDDHGTHTIGTVMGIDRLTDDTIGVAPNATWIGAKIICGNDTGTEDNIGSFQWAINPDGDSSTITDIPDAINNSWRDPSIDDDCQSVYVDVLKAMEAVGIAVIFSAGNSGPRDSTLTAPHNINYDLVNLFTVGALNGNSNQLNIADFSSRGPSRCFGSDSSLIIKPEVSAPGVSVRSCVRDGEYDYFNGTSMASPHVAGAILLLKEAFPYLTGRDLKFALYNSARDLGTPGEDNDYGTGIIDLKSAFDYLVAEGNTPVDPSMANDALLIHVGGPDFYCGSRIFPEFLVENLGTETMTSLEIHMNFPQISKQEIYTWTGSMAPGERITIVADEIQMPRGTWAMTVDLRKPNGVDDEHPLNNRYNTHVVVTERESLEAFATDDPDGEICSGTRALLRNGYELNSPGSITYEWYDSPSGGDLVGTGQAFLTPPLTQSTTYYADVLVEFDNVGAPNIDIGDSRSSPIVLGGLRFDAEIPFLLKSVKVYPSKTGFINITLEDANEEEVISRDFLVSATNTEQVITLNYQIPQGEDWELNLTTGDVNGTEYVPLKFNNDGAEFPYTIDGIISITGNTSGSGSGGRYWNFYDWKIEHREACGRTPVRVEINPNSSVPSAAFTLSDPTVDVNNNPTVQFTDESSDATEWLWHFGDGNQSTEQNPTHTFSAIGTYIVSLTITNAAGCTASVIDTVKVIDSSVSSDNLIEIEGVKVFPNPTDGILNIEVEINSNENISVQLTDLLGTPLRSIVADKSKKEKLQMDISDLTSGVYLLILKTETGQAVRKILKL